MTTAPDRPPLRKLDLAAGIVLALIGALIGFVMLAYMGQLPQLAAVCEGVPVDGLRCSPDFLNTITIVGYGIVIFAWFLSFGFFVVRVLRRRIGFFWPIIGVVVMILGYYLVLIILSASYQPAT
jgi:hypothetical protein